VGLVILCLTVYLPGLFTIPPIDRDESRFAQASRQMFESAALPDFNKDPAMHSGGWVVPMVQDRPRLNKPPLVYWLQVASAWALTRGDPLRDEIWMYRIPGVVCAILTVLMTWRMGLSMFDPRAAVLGAALLAVCPLIVFDAHQARADQLLLTTVVGTQWALWQVWKGRGRAAGHRQSETGRSEASGPMRERGSELSRARLRALELSGGRVAPILFWVCIGVSILSKGPIGPMIAGLTCAALCLASRSWRWMLGLRPIVGVVIVAAMVGPWLYAVGEHVGWEKYLAIVQDETIGRSLEPKEGHWGPPGYHVVLLAVLFWPGSLTTAMAVGRAFRRGLPAGGAANPERARRATEDAGSSDVAGTSGRSGGIGRIWRALAAATRRLRYGFAGRSAELFCLAWIVPAWIVFELIGTKLPHYTMPMYPAVALVSARYLCTVAGRGARAVGWERQRAGIIAWVVIGAVVVGGFFLMFSVVSVWWLARADAAPLWVRASWWALIPWVLCALGTVAFYRGAVSVRDNSRAVGALVLCAVGYVFSVGAFLQFMAPKVLPGAETARIGATLRWAVARGYVGVATEYHEDSVLFHTRGAARRINGGDIDAWWADHPEGVALVRTPDEQGWALERGYFPTGGTRGGPLCDELGISGRPRLTVVTRVQPEFLRSNRRE